MPMMGNLSCAGVVMSLACGPVVKLRNQVQVW
jgi:hypothetical protein